VVNAELSIVVNAVADAVGIPNSASVVGEIGFLGLPPAWPALPIANSIAPLYSSRAFDKRPRAAAASPLEWQEFGLFRFALSQRCRCIGTRIIILKAR